MTYSKDTTETTDSPSVISLNEMTHSAAHDGSAWSQTTDDLNVNLVVLHTGHPIGEHINREVDVLLVGIEGAGRVTVGSSEFDFGQGQLVVVPKGTPRSITPTSERFAYLTCHKRRAGLWPTLDR